MTISPDNDAESETRLRETLEPGERLLWSGRPRQGLMLRTSDVLAIPFSLLWCGFAIVWEWIAIRGGAPLLFRLWGLPFCAVGLYLVAGRFFADAWQRRRTFYGVSDRRVVILTAAPLGRIRSLILDGLDEIELTETRAGAGTLTFGRNPLPTYGRRRRAAAALVPRFEGIPDAHTVLRIIRDARRTLSRA